MWVKLTSLMVPDADFGNVLIGSDLSHRDVEMFDWQRLEGSLHYLKIFVGMLKAPKVRVANGISDLWSHLTRGDLWSDSCIVRPSRQAQWHDANWISTPLDFDGTSLSSSWWALHPQSPHGRCPVVLVLVPSGYTWISWNPRASHWKS